MKHAEHLAALGLVEVEQDILANDEAEVLARRRQAQQIVLGKRHLRPDFRDHLHETRLVGRLEIAVLQGLGNPFHFLLGIGSGGDLRAELRLHVGGVNPHVAEDEVRHPLPQHHGQRVGLGPMRQPASQMRMKAWPHKVGRACSMSSSSVCESRKKKLNAMFGTIATRK